MQKLIVWFYPNNRRIQKNQFHVLASSVRDALDQLEKNKPFPLKVMGVGCYREMDPTKSSFVNLQIF